MTSFSLSDLSSLKTPEKCIADFCLIPIATPSTSLSPSIAAVQLLLQQSGLEYSMHSAGTTVEGPWDTVMNLIGQAHTLLHREGVARIQTDIRVGTRIDKEQSFNDKVASVQKILAKKEEVGKEGEE